MKWKFWAFIDFFGAVRFFQSDQIGSKATFPWWKKNFSTVDDITFKGIGK